MNNLDVTFELDYNYGNLKRVEYGKNKIYTIQDLLDEIEYLYEENTDFQKEVDRLEETIEDLEDKLKQYEEKESESVENE